jgi:hypothetical protein
VAYEFSQLVPELRPFAERLVAVCARAGVNPQVTSTRRSHSSQARLYRAYLAGRTPYPVAPPGFSAHEYGWAFDMVVTDAESQADAGQVWRSWGGTWGGEGDPVHFELPGATASLKGSAPPPAGSSLKHKLAVAADFLIGWVPGIGEVELIATLLSWGFPRSEILAFLASPIEKLSGV